MGKIFICIAPLSGAMSHTGIALIRHITHVRKMHEKNIYNKVTLNEMFCFFTIGAALKGKNLLPLGANSFL